MTQNIKFSQYREIWVSRNMRTSKSRNKHVAKISCYKLGREAKPDSSNLRMLLPRDEAKTQKPNGHDYSCYSWTVCLADFAKPKPSGLGGGGGGGGVGFSTNFFTGRLHPKDQPLTVYTFFERKDTPFVYLPLTNSLSTPFKYLV